MKYLFLIFTILLFSSITNISAQNYGTLRGFVTDSTNGEILAYATVIVLDTKQGCITDSRGYYAIPSIPAGKHIIIFTYVGYGTKQKEINILEDKVIDLKVQLVHGGINYNPIIKTGEFDKKLNATDAGLYNLSGKDIQIDPKGIEADVMRSLQLIPGVKTSNDISSRYYVRGGASDQNLVMIDGVTIYNPFHALGIFSIIDPEIINNVQFYKGNFPAEYGGRLSSIMNIKTNDGNKFRYAGSANVSFLTGKVLLEGPIPDGSFILSGRKSYFGKVMKNFLNNQTAPFDFYDLSMKVNYANDEFMKNAKFTVKTLLSNDNIKYGDPKLADYNFQNNIIGVEYFQILEKPFYADINMSVSNYNADVIPNLSLTKQRANDVKEFAWDNNFTFLFDSKDEIGVGLQVKSFTSDFNYQNFIGNNISYNSTGANFDIYVKYKFIRYDNFGCEAGIRFSPVILTVKPSQLFFPDINVTYRVLPELALKAAWGVYKQEIMTYSDDNDVVSIFEPYLVIPDYLSPSKAIHYMVGFDLDLLPGISMQVESYYKLLLHIVDINRNKVFASDPDLISTNGESYGVEYSAKYKSDNIFASFGYTLAYAFEGIDAVKYYPKYDSRHQVDLLVGWSFGSGWKASAVWTLSTGRPFTQSAGFYDKIDIMDFWNQYLTEQATKPYGLLGELNAARLPVYHRLDFSLSREFVVYFTKMTFEANIINLYNRKNVFYFDRSTGKRVNMLPFLPTISLRIDI